MEILNSIAQIEILPSLYLVKQNREVKKCQWCQVQSIDRKELGRRVANNKNTFSLKLFNTRHDVTGYVYGEHENGSKTRAGVWVQHIDNRSDCYRYTIEETETIFEHCINIKPSSPLESFYHRCPGHIELLGRRNINHKYTAPH